MRMTQLFLLLHVPLIIRESREISISFFQIREENTKRCGIIVAKEQTEHNMSCMVCGTQIVYDKTSQEQECIYCGSTEASPIYCPDGHFVCDSCHSKDAIAFLELLAEVDTCTEPIDVVDKALIHPSFKFHGPEDVPFLEHVCVFQVPH